MGNIVVNRRTAEREFYYRALGGNFPQIRIDQLARRFYLLYLSGHGGAPTNAAQMPLDQLESIWLKAFIQTNGGTPPSGVGKHPVGFKSDLWREALALTPQAGQITKNMNDNKYTFFLNG